MHVDWDSAVTITLFTVGGGWLAARSASALGHRPLSLPVAMTACGILAIWAFHVVIGANAFLLSLCLAWGLLVLAIVDWMDFRLPDMLTLPLIVAGLAAAAVLPAEDVFDTVSAEAIGQLVGSDVSGAR